MPAAAAPLVKTPSAITPWRVIIRALWPYEVSEFRHHLRRLDAVTRIERFGRGVSDDWLRRYAAETDWLSGAVAGCWIDGTLRGVAELRRYGGRWSPIAEAALSIEPAYQNHGLGSLLARRIILVARNRGIAALHILFSAGNPRMRRIALAHHARLTFAGDQIEAELALPAPDAATLTEEWVAEGMAMMRALALPRGLLPT